MFSIKPLKTTISLPPSFYNSQIKESLSNSLHNQPIITNQGIIVAITDITDISQMPINVEGIATFKISYKALMLNLRVGEVVDLQVIEINDAGMFLSLSEQTSEFLSVFVSSTQMKGEAFGMQRVRIVGCKMEGSKIVAIGSVRDECLGQISDF